MRLRNKNDDALEEMIKTSIAAEFVYLKSLALHDREALRQDLDFDTLRGDILEKLLEAEGSRVYYLKLARSFCALALRPGGVKYAGKIYIMQGAEWTKDEVPDFVPMDLLTP